MTKQLTRRLRRLALLGLITVGSLNTAAVTRAGEFDGGSETSSAVEDWCGWGTHDSMPITPQDNTLTRPVTRTSSTFDQSLAVIAATATAKTGLSFEQIIEPFAMVGTYQSSPIEQINIFQQWWDFAKITVAAKNLVENDSHDDAGFTIASTSPHGISTEYVPFVDFGGEVADHVHHSEAMRPDWQQHDDDQFRVVTSEDLLRRQLDQLAKEEPLDANADDDINRIFAAPAPVIRFASKSPSTIGSAPIIMSLEEPYLPYDLGQRDLRQWLPTGLTAKPFCLRDHLVVSDADPMWSERTTEPKKSQAELLQASADCLLDEWIWNVEEALESGSTLRQALELKSIGTSIASLWSGGQQITTKATHLLASVWPEAPAKPAAARLLLARAEAIEAAPPEQQQAAVDLQTAREQLSVAVTTVRKWIANAESIRRDWLRIAEANPSSAVSR